MRHRLFRDDVFQRDNRDAVLGNVKSAAIFLRIVANTYLEGTYTEFYPDISRDAEGLKRLFKQFPFPGGIPSRAA